MLILYATICSPIERAVIPEILETMILTAATYPMYFTLGMLIALCIKHHCILSCVLKFTITVTT